MIYWWSVTTSTGREFWVKGDSYFQGRALQEAWSRMDNGETIRSYERKEAVR